MNFLTSKTAINGESKKSSNLRNQLFTTRDTQQRKHALFRRVSPCVRFVAKRRESTRRNLSRRVGRLSRFVRVKIFSNIRSKSIDTNVRVCCTEHTFDKEAFFFDGHDSTDFASTLRYNICYGGTLWNIKLTKGRCNLIKVTSAVCYSYPTFPTPITPRLRIVIPNLSYWNVSGENVSKRKLSY